MTLVARLSGGNPRSLGEAETVVADVLNEPELLPELFDCLFVADETIRMRAGDAVEKVCRKQPNWLEPYADRLLTEVAEIDQPSVQWHLAQMLGEIQLSPEQEQAAGQLLLAKARPEGDWIVIGYALETLTKFAQEDRSIRSEVLSVLATFQSDSRKAVAKRATRLLGRLTEVELG